MHVGGRHLEDLLEIERGGDDASDLEEELELLEPPDRKSVV
jgi:hypothetical protein